METQQHQFPQTVRRVEPDDVSKLLTEYLMYERSPRHYSVLTLLVSFRSQDTPLWNTWQQIHSNNLKLNYYFFIFTTKTLLLSGWDWVYSRPLSLHPIKILMGKMLRLFVNNIRNAWTLNIMNDPRNVCACSQRRSSAACRPPAPRFTSYSWRG